MEFIKTMAILKENSCRFRQTGYKKAKSKRRVYFKPNTKNIKVPARQFIHSEETYGINKELLGKFIRGIHKALKNKG